MLHSHHFFIFEQNFKTFINICKIFFSKSCNETKKFEFTYFYINTKPFNKSKEAAVKQFQRIFKEICKCFVKC